LVGLFSDIAYSALALLIAVLAIYLTVRLLGKLAKFVVCTVILAVVAAVIWFIFSNGGAGAISLPEFFKSAATVLKFAT
jgi:vacuolar-type H+-ATPase subunit I/STV1